MKLAFQLVLFLLHNACFALAQQPISSDALRQPIIEGKSIAGISLGDTEMRVAEKMGGVPHLNRRAGKPQTVLGYRDMTEDGGLYLDVFMENNFVVGLELLAISKSNQGYLYTGKGNKDYQFGDPVEKVKTIYGIPYKTEEDKKGSILWYKKEGIIFEFFDWDKGFGKRLSGIVILSPNAGIPAALKEDRGGPFAKWD